LVAGGIDLKSVEVVDLQNPNLICQNLPDLPNLLLGATGQLLDETRPMICGGKITIDGTRYDSCDCFSLTSDRWTKTGEPLQFCRYNKIISFIDIARRNFFMIKCPLVPSKQ
jgi:hypothetical protein